MMLLERTGEVVTREELQKKLWPADTFVDFERGLNRAINKLREALGDGADSPRFIETLPRRGYRFVPPVETADAKEFETGLENNGSTAAAPNQPVVPWAVASILAVVAIIAFWAPWRARHVPADRPFLQLDLDVGPDEFSEPAISRDGMRVVFVSNGSLAIRYLDQAKMTRLAGTERASYPFFSPNGQWVAFFASGKLQKVAVGGGAPAPIVLCDAPARGGASWGDDDTIIAALDSSEGLSRIPAAGGAPHRLTDAKADSSGTRMHLRPQTLPGGKGVLFVAANGSGQSSLRVVTVNDGKVKTLVSDASYGRYLANGYLVYSHRGALFAAAMDAGRLELTGLPVLLVDGVSGANFDVSPSGTLVYRSAGAGNKFTVSWLYPSGKTEPVLPSPANYLGPRLSPDGTRLALSVMQEGKQNLWVYDLRRETSTRLPSDATHDILPTWTPDGEFIAFRSGNTLAWTRSDGSGKVEHLPGAAANAGPWSFSRSGKWLAFWPLQPGSDLWIAAVERSPGSLRLGQPHPLLQERGSKGAPAISPDDRWVAYTSSETGRFEIDVMPFSPEEKTASHKWPVSNGGGLSPRWSHDGQLFYQYDRRVQVAAWTAKGGSFVAEKPRVWSERLLGDTGIFNAFDVAPDGKRVLALFAAEEPKPQTLLRVLLNVDTELRRRGAMGGK